MRVALITHDTSLRHDTGYGHPERASRIGAVVSGVKASGLEVVELEAEPVPRGTLEAVHRPDYVDAIETFCRNGGGALDPDTVAGPESWTAALNAAGGGITAAEALIDGTAEVGFVAMRPPGHHALAARAMGFCLFNNVAVLARWLEARGNRVAIVDWDVHHGNGTQATFYDDPDVLYVSFHEHPQYPGTGHPTEIGSGAAAGTTINFAWPPGTGGSEYHWALEHLVVPILVQFDPGWALVSCGYDAHRSDPLARLELVEADYAAMANRLTSALPSARWVYVLEGGYDLEALTGSATATLRGAAGLGPVPPAGSLASVQSEAMAGALWSRLAEQWDLG